MNYCDYGRQWFRAALTDQAYGYLLINALGLLTVIDLTELGAQPMATQDELYHVVFNGDINNTRTTIQDLTPFSLAKDTDLVKRMFVNGALRKFVMKFNDGVSKMFGFLESIENIGGVAH